MKLNVEYAESNKERVPIVRVEDMTHDNYDSDEDVRATGGRIGMALAEKRYQHNKRLENEEAIERELERSGKVSLLNKCYSFLKECPRDAEDRKEILERYFPERFGKKGNQKLHDYSDNNMFGVYQGLVRSTEDMIKRLEEELQ